MRPVYPTRRLCALWGFRPEAKWLSSLVLALADEQVGRLSFPLQAEIRVTHLTKENMHDSLDVEV
jgi:hypothetical protein